MKTMKKTAAGIALLATAGLVAGPMAGMSQAWAAETGTITITKTDANNTATYGAVKIFDADVADDGKVSNIAWASAGIETAVKACLPEAVQSKTAQEIAEYIGENLGTTGEGAILLKDDLGMKIANALKGKSTDTITPGTAATLDAGYWVVIPTGGNGENASASSPIYAVIGGEAVTVTEKTSVPTLTKTVKEDSTGNYGEEADHTLGQEVEYRLAGTISANFASFETYQYNFVDTFGDGLDFVAGSVKVSVDGADITDKFTVTFADQKLEIKCANLVGVTGIAAGKTIQVDYKAVQNGTTASESGIENEAYVEYTHAPGSSELSKTTTDTAKDYSYALKVVKTDNATGETLAGAKFTVQAKNGNYIKLDDATGKISEMPADTTAENAYEFTTGADGLITLSGLDADTYVITETQAPANYIALAAPFEVTINATDRTTPTKTITAGATADTVAAGDPTASAAVAAAGATHEIKNHKQSNLPITGEQGILALMVIGGAVVVGSSISIARSRRKSNED